MKRAAQLSIVLLVLLASTCDPGIHYEPKDWEKVSVRRWVKSFGQIEIETSDLGGLIGETWIDPEISIRNRAKSPAIIESAILKTGDAEYLARTPRYDWGKWEVAPGEAQRLDLQWEFDDDKPIYKVLKDPVEMTLRIKVGAERMEVIIPMFKSA